MNGDKLKNELRNEWEIEEINEAEDTIKYICTSENNNVFTVDKNGKVKIGKDIVKKGLKLITMYNNGLNCENPENCTDKTHLHFGDYVAYSPNDDGDGDASTVLTYNPDDPEKTGTATAGALTGYEAEQNIEQDTTLQWRVLGSDGTHVLLISATPTTNEASQLYVNGVTGYNNFINVVNDTCQALYSKNGIGTAKSISEKEIDDYLGGSNVEKEDSTTAGQVLSGRTYNVDTMYYEILNNGNIVSTGGAPLHNVDVKVTAYTFWGVLKTLKEQRYLDMLFGEECEFEPYWYADRGIDCGSNFAAVVGMQDEQSCGQRAGLVYLGYNNEEYPLNANFRPIVTLNADVTTDEVAVLNN